MQLRNQLALGLAKVTQWSTRRIGLGGGTNLPGRLARRLSPDVLHHQAQRLEGGVVLVSGTNGKTTTSRMLATILEQAGTPALHNRAGANLITGLTAATLDLGIWGKPRYPYAIFEVDEAHLPAAIRETQPRVVLLLNLFRDQLDRYGEVDTLANTWRTALASLPASSTLVLNADDPAVADLHQGLKAQVVYYGLNDTRHGNDALRHAGDSIFCRRCGTAYEYNPAFYGHIGIYSCPACGHHRPDPNFALQRLQLDGTNTSTLQMTWQQPNGTQAVEIQLPLPGLYNAMNALAATAAATALGINLATSRAALEHFTAAFGRIERFDLDDHPTLMALIKNPIGASETVRMITSDAQEPLDLLIAINDNIADGTDVSWLWDADFEALNGRVRSVLVCGTRAYDMAVRLKYAGIAEQSLHIEPNLQQALTQFARAVPASQQLTILPTYTAMLELRALLVQRQILKPFWES